MDLKLKDRVAVVTGASKGIGAGIAKAFAKAGAKVVVNYASSREGAEKVVGEITKNGGIAIAVQGDVTQGNRALGGGVVQCVDQAGACINAINVEKKVFIAAGQGVQRDSGDQQHKREQAGIAGIETGTCREPGSVRWHDVPA